jgi:hypothetical protein
MLSFACLKKVGLVIYCVVGSVAEPEPQGAASFGRSRSRKAMRLRLRLRRLRSDNGTKHGYQLKNNTKFQQFITHLVDIFSNMNHTESDEQDSFIMCLNFSSF